MNSNSDSNPHAYDPQHVIIGLSVVLAVSILVIIVSAYKAYRARHGSGWNTCCAFASVGFAACVAGILVITLRPVLEQHVRTT